MEEKRIAIFGRKASLTDAQTLLKLHHEAFSVSACRKCPGICCKDCAESDGYLYRDDLSLEEIDALKEKYSFNDRNGFKGKFGCNLPVQLRSTTCVSFYCETLSRPSTFKDKTLAKRNTQIGRISVDVLEVDLKVEKLRSKMEEVFDT